MGIGDTSYVLKIIYKTNSAYSILPISCKVIFKRIFEVRRKRLVYIRTLCGKIGILYFYTLGSIPKNFCPRNSTLLKAQIFEFSSQNQKFNLTHTILKVKFLSKNSILTKPQHFHEFFTQIFFWQFFSWNQSCQQLKSPKPQHFREFFTLKNRQFSREIKVEFLDKKWRFRTVCSTSHFHSK